MEKACLLAALLAGLSGCSEEAAPVVCPAGNEIRGVCAGVPAALVCGRHLCTSVTEGVVCVRTVEVNDDAGLQAAIAGATAGTCLALAPGSYGTANLPGGVRLLGRSADAVSLEGVTLGAGAGAVLRGVSVRTGGVKVEGVKAATIASVRVSGSVSDGIEVLPGSSVTIVTSTVEGAQRYGLSAMDAADVTVEQSAFSKNAAAGVWAQCGVNGCDCTVEAKLSIESSIVRGNLLLGMGLRGVSASLRQVDIVDTSGDPAEFYRDGAGLAVASCSDLHATGLRVQRSNAYGVLIDESHAELGKNAEGEGIEITENRGVGLWVKNINDKNLEYDSEEEKKLVGVELENGQIDANHGVGIGVSGGTRGFIICRSGVSNTRSSQMTVLQGGGFGAKPEDVGYGLAWLDKSEVSIDDSTFGGNELASILIDGAAEGSIIRVTLERGDNDEKKGILQQNFNGGMQPVVNGSSVILKQTSKEVHPVPVAPKAF